jgi:hypothetical protein
VVAYRADGSLFVQQTGRGGQNGVLLRVAENGSQTVLANDAYGAAASSDGSMLAYVSAGGQAFAVPAGGGASVPLGVNGVLPNVQAAFSPNWKQVAVTGTDGPPDWHPVGYVARTDGSRAVTLPWGVATFGWALSGAVLIVCGRDPNGGTLGLATVRPDGTQLTPLAQAYSSYPTFSPNGLQIACVDNVGNNEVGLMRLPYAPYP